MEILIPLFGIFMIIAIVLGPSYIRAKTREKMLDTMRLAYEKGQPVPPELIEAINTDPRPSTPMIRSPRDRAEAELKSGIIIVAVALALIALGSAISWVDDEEAFYIFSGIAAFPGFIGLALVIFGLIGRNRAKV